MRYLKWLVFLALLLLAGCSSQGQVTASPLSGETLFQESMINQAPGCVTCHSMQPGVKLVGPSLADATTQAEAALNSPDYTGAATTPAEFIRESIIKPDVYVPEGYISGTMYQDYGQQLDTTQIEALVSYLLAQK